MNTDNVKVVPSAEYEKSTSVEPDVGWAFVSTDGSNGPGNPGYGGWGAVLRVHGQDVVEVSGPLGNKPIYTNNDAELTAMVEGLEELRRSGWTGHVRVRSDSQWALKCASGQWRRKAAKFDALWRRLDDLVSRYVSRSYRVVWTWVKGHSGDPDNERADELATLGRQRAEEAAKQNGVAVHCRARHQFRAGSGGKWWTMLRGGGLEVSVEQDCPPWIVSPAGAAMTSCYGALRGTMVRWGGSPGVSRIEIRTASPDVRRWLQGETPAEPGERRVLERFQQWQAHYAVPVEFEFIRPEEQAGITCPKCGGVAVRTDTQYGQRHDCCELWSWGGKPLVDRRTHEARKAAHAAFDALWKSGAVSRGKAYQLLAKELGVPEAEAHMARMPADLAERVPGAVRAIKERLQ